MDIPNLTSNPSPTQTLTQAPQAKKPSILPLKGVLITLALSLIVGFFISRYYPLSGKKTTSLLSGGQEAISTENITDKSTIEVGKLYGDTATVFKDSATGTIEKGSINGVGTHILNREGGTSQRVSLTSSVVDLDLFVNRKVEVKGETNASKQTAWLLDVGSVNVLE